LDKLSYVNDPIFWVFGEPLGKGSRVVLYGGGLHRSKRE
jgi:hypothetical protein